MTEPSMFGYVTLLGLLDVDGDGIDEVFFEDGFPRGVVRDDAPVGG